ncbi:MAG: site-specific integrase [Ktedonobacteraceae bacterium]
MADEEKIKPEARRKSSRRRKRSVHGGGSVFLRSDGRYGAKFKVEETGKWKYLYGDTEKEVTEKLQQAFYEQKQGILATGPKQKLETYLTYWLDVVKKPELRRTTYARYRIHIYKHILPRLGQVPVQKLTPQQVQSLYSDLQETQSAGSIRMLHSILHEALDNAVRWNIVSRNICDAVTPPKPGKHEAQTLTPDQARKLLATVKGHDLEALLIVALTTGMRHGELLALKWQDIDLESSSLQVRRTVSFLAGQGYKETEPKTDRGRRRILLPQIALEALKQHRIHQREAKLQAGEAWQNLDLVFSNAHGYYMHSNNLRRLFRALLKQAELPEMRFHDLRHSAATLLLSMGVHPKVVQEILGHSNISVTMDVYSHVLPSMQDDAQSKWDTLL